MPKGEQGKGDWEASPQALEYAKYALAELNRVELWTLAERLDVVMQEQVKQFIAEIRK
jgi:hypothetical protein